MDKKKKRASFSIDTSKKEKEEPIVSQPRVKVVIEEETIKSHSQAKKGLIVDEIIIKSDPVADELPVVDGVDDLPKEVINTTAQSFIEEEELEEDEESTVTASATPDGDSMLVTDEVEDIPVAPPPVSTHKKVEPAVAVSAAQTEQKPEIETEPEQEVITSLQRDEVENIESVSQEEKEQVARPPITIHTSPQGKETTSERQQEQVAELFNKNSSQNMPEITVHQQSNTRGIVLWAVTMIAIALGVGGGLILFTTRGGKNNSSNQVVVSTPTPAVAENPTPLPSATPTPQAVNREEISVQVLNGGGVSGAGSRMEDFLVNLGYDVVDVSNADEYTYENTVIVTKPSNKELAKTLESDLSGSYELDDSVATLDEESPYDVQVIVGSNE